MEFERLTSYVVAQMHTKTTAALSTKLIVCINIKYVTVMTYFLYFTCLVMYNINYDVQIIWTFFTYYFGIKILSRMHSR